MTRHGLFDEPDKQGWFDYERCSSCGVHWQSCECGREKSGIEKKLEVGSQFDILTPIAAATGIPVGCLMVVAAIGMALIVAYGEMK